MKPATLYLCHNFAGVKYEFNSAVQHHKRRNADFRYIIERREIIYPNGERVIFRSPDSLLEGNKFKEVICVGPVRSHPRFKEAMEIIRSNTIQ